MKNTFKPLFLEKSKKATNKTFGRRNGLKLRPTQPQPQVLNLQLRPQNFGLWSNTAKICMRKKKHSKLCQIHICICIQFNFELSIFGSIVSSASEIIVPCWLPHKTLMILHKKPLIMQTIRSRRVIFILNTTSNLSNFLATEL